MRTKIAKKREPHPEIEERVEKILIKKDKRRGRKKPVEGMLEKQGYMDLYEGPAKKAKKKRRFTKVDEVV